MKRNSYRKISNFGNNLIANAASNPLLYCATDNVTNHMLNGFNPDTSGQESKNCQLFLADYCATKWNSVCEKLCSNNTKSIPDLTNPNTTNAITPIVKDISLGQLTLINIARKKYMISMKNCKAKYVPFDPNVPTSPMLLTWQKTSLIECLPEYDVIETDIDKDPVMSRILDTPSIAFDILLGIYKTRINNKTLEKLKGSRLYNFFKQNNDFVAVIKANNLFVSGSAFSNFPGMIQ